MNHWIKGNASFKISYCQCCVPIYDFPALFIFALSQMSLSASPHPLAFYFSRSKHFLPYPPSQQVTMFHGLLNTAAIIRESPHIPRITFPEYSAFLLGTVGKPAILVSNAIRLLVPETPVVPVCRGRSHHLLHGQNFFVADQCHYHTVRSSAEQSGLKICI